MWLIWSNEHKAWWCDGERGYTQSREKAGRYTQGMAADIVAGANKFLGDGDEPNETMIEAND